MTPQRREEIESGTVLVAYGNDENFARAQFREELDLARSRKIPIVLILKAGTRLPEGTLQGIGTVMLAKSQHEVSVLTLQVIKALRSKGLIPLP